MHASEPGGQLAEAYVKGFGEDKTLFKIVQDVSAVHRWNSFER